MSEIGETPESAVVSESSKASDRKQSLTVEEISNIRTDKRVRNGLLHEYTTADGIVSTTFISPKLDSISDNGKEEIIIFLRSRQDGEGYRYEPLVVNALLKQFQIAKKFGLSTDSLYTEFRLNVEDKGTILLDDWGDLYLRVLDEHVARLKKQGATDEQIITEFAGHMFHESVHNEEGNMRKVLFNGKSPFGEIATITAQLAYYLEEGYSGPISYDKGRYRDGFKKIQNNQINSRDYDIATYVGVTLLMQSLRETYPEFVPNQSDIDPYTICRTVIAKLSPEKRQNLIPALKKAIANSADEKVYKDVLDKARQEKLENNR